MTTTLDTATVQRTWQEREANEARYPLRDSENRCWACARPLTKAALRKAWWVHEVDGGGKLLAVAEEYGNEGSDLGWWPLGTDCAKTVPVEFRSNQPMNGVG
jgi:hypothetical protein